jgi:hypothetical protein
MQTLYFLSGTVSPRPYRQIVTTLQSGSFRVRLLGGTKLGDVQQTSDESFLSYETTVKRIDEISAELQQQGWTEVSLASWMTRNWLMAAEWKKWQDKLRGKDSQENR